MPNRLGALGRHAVGLTVLAHDLPGEAACSVWTLLLTIDFRAGWITLA
jgi:hypothetical protein